MVASDRIQAQTTAVRTSAHGAHGEAPESRVGRAYSGLVSARVTQDPERQVLVDRAGRAVLSYVPYGGSPGADAATALVEVDDVVPVVLEQMAGALLASSEDALVDALVAAGAVPVRSAHLFSRDLVEDPPDPAWGTPALPPGVRLETDVRTGGVELIDQGRLSVRAYPHGHADHEGDDPEYAATQLARLYGGEYLGEVLDGSVLALDGDRLVAVMVVNRMPGRAPLGGPWVSEVFRDPHPHYVGLGTTLLHRAMAVLGAAGEESLSLVVTEGNPARSIYERAGFRYCGSSRKVRLPG